MQGLTRFLAPDEISSDLIAQWHQLAEHAAEPNAFMEAWFILPSLKHLALPPSLRLAFVHEDDGQLIGVGAFFMARRYGRMVLNHVQSWAHYNAFLGSPLVREGLEVPFWQKLLLALDEASWADGLVHMNGLVEASPVHRGLVTAAQRLGRPCDTVHSSERALLESGLSGADYYESNVRKKKRKEINRLKSRLQEMGTLAFVTAKTDAEIAQFTQEFLALEAAGWKGKAGSALTCSPDTHAFFCDLIARSWAQGKLDFQRLSLDGKPIAMLVNFVSLPGSFSYKIAFDEEFARFSPGVLIQLENLSILDRPGFGWMDSCAIENHSMINSIWRERRSIIRVSLPLGGLKRGMVFRFCRTAEDSWAQLKKLKSVSPAHLLSKPATAMEMEREIA